MSSCQKARFDVNQIKSCFEHSLQKCKHFCNQNFDHKDIVNINLDLKKIFGT